MTAILDVLFRRRTLSIRNLAEPAPRGEELALIIAAGAAAPDHGKLVPFRFVGIGDGFRARFADIWQEAIRALNPEPTAQELAKARDRAQLGPVQVALVARLQTHPKIGMGDQWLTVGCALQNLLLAAEAQGFSAAIISGPALDTLPMRHAFALGDEERLVSFIAFGTAIERIEQRIKPPMEAVYSVIES